MCKWQIGILSGEDFFTSLLKISVLNNATREKIFIWINLKVTKIDYFLNLYEWDTKEQIVKNDNYIVQIFIYLYGAVYLRFFWIKHVPILWLLFLE